MEHRPGKKQQTGGGGAARVCVVGAGISGLGTATVLQDRLPGCDVTIMADKFTPDTTSDGSGGFWEPHLLHDTPQEKAARWSGATLEHLLSLVTSPDAGAVGAKLLSGYLLATHQLEDPWWSKMTLGSRPLTPQEMRIFPQAKWGRFHTSVQVDPKKLLPFLMKRFVARGGKLVRRSLNSLEELCGGGYHVVINCSGLGARQLARDTSLFPVRGQVVRVKAPWIKHFYVFISERGAETYLLPGSDALTVGGTQTKDDWRTAVDERDSESIWRAAVDFLPSLKDAEVVHHWAGLRPCRPEVRLERETLRSGAGTLEVVHNYGHGGAGITLFYGCAVEASDLVASALSRSKL